MKHKCSLQAYISEDHIKRFTKLLKEPFEIGSTLYFNPPKVSNGNLKLKSNKEKTIKGDSSSVDPPIAPVSLHTHPYSCYEDEDCFWGWPSGEDMRESVRHSIGGNVAHFVFTVEGTYVITVNPCLLEYFKTLAKGSDNDQEDLGELLYYLDRYFVSFHGLRSNDLQKAAKKSGKKPISNKFFIDYANKFNFDSFKKPVPFYETSITGPKISENSLIDILKYYDLTTFVIDKKYDIHEGEKFSRKSQKEINEFVNNLNKNFNSCSINKYNFGNSRSQFWGDSWFNVDFFKTENYFKEPKSKNMPHFKVWFKDQDGICYPDVILSNKKIKRNNNRL